MRISSEIVRCLTEQTKEQLGSLHVSLAVSLSDKDRKGIEDYAEDSCSLASYMIRVKPGLLPVQPSPKHLCTFWHLNSLVLHKLHMENQPVLFSAVFILYVSFLGPFCASSGEESFVYSGFASTGAANLTLDGSAMVTTTGLLQLTDSMPNIQGHAFYPTPLRFKKQSNGIVQSFSVAFMFGIISPYSDASTDGMAFVVAPNKGFPDAKAAQFLGLLNISSDNSTSNHMFAVEIDTAQNTELDDIDGYHVGIDINSLHSKKSQHIGFYNDQHGGLLKNLTLTGSNCKPVQVWVDYDGETTQINVTLAPIKVTKPTRPLLSVPFNLSTVLTDQAYIGFSAATGPLTSHYYVLGWSFAMNAPAPPIEISRLPRLPCPGDNRLQKILQILLPIVAVALIFIVVMILVRRQQRYAELREDWEVEFGPHRFSYKDLFNATEGFKSKHILGVGGFGKVYKGVLRTSKLEVAVKKVSHGSNQGMKEFISEVVSIGHLRHRNLVQLLGYCRRKGELLLVYDYMPNGSLDKYLYGEDNKPVLNWAQRMQIIKDVASGLFYLHEKWDKVVIHRDIKASNVLLDSEMNARLGDFGLARLYEHGTNPQTTHLVGTMGFIAPELARTGKASPLTDVFAFGTFLLEVTCGRWPISNSAHHGRKMLVDWVLQHWHQGSLPETVDPKLHGIYNVDEACLVLTLGLMCSHPIPGARPIMRQVMQYLDGDAPLPEFTPATLNSSLLAIMHNEGVDPYVAQYPWSGNSLGTMTPDILSGR
jgi:serine/threonine protein kinase|uniref:non-specific serine/threonine protein kinase n=5 Tax=Oryza sativa TaxID=4530 RepID=Q6YT51_ORYSJ|nr:putative receptor-like protein kinase [Oryza sativa Japonica Group]BAC84741.1 putative receptor kinase Lecrk [Oryza sativa Japonica Group]